MEKESLPTIEEIGDLPEIEGFFEDFEQKEDFEEEDLAEESPLIEDEEESFEDSEESFENYPYPDEEETDFVEEEKIGDFEFFDHPKIVFEGKVDNKPRGSAMARIMLFYGFAFMPLQWISVAIAFGINVDPMFALFFVGLGTLVPACFFIMLFCYLVVPTRLEIKDCMIIVGNRKGKIKHDEGGHARLDFVHSVLDYGSYYYLKSFPIPGNLVCQKNLLIEGTLEEFEAIFEQAGIPIIRKYSTEEK